MLYFCFFTSVALYFPTGIKEQVSTRPDASLLYFLKDQVLWKLHCRTESQKRYLVLFYLILAWKIGQDFKCKENSLSFIMLIFSETGSIELKWKIPTLRDGTFKKRERGCLSPGAYWCSNKESRAFLIKEGMRWAVLNQSSSNLASLHHVVKKQHIGEKSSLWQVWRRILGSHLIHLPVIWIPEFPFLSLLVTIGIPYLKLKPLTISYAVNCHQNDLSLLHWYKFI